MRRARIRRAAALVALSLLAVGLPTGLAAGPAGAAPKPKAFNYITQAKKLSQPIYPETIRESFNVEMADGETLYVEVVRPDPALFGVDGGRGWPTIMEISPYHGTLADRSGTRIFPDPVDEFGRQIGLTGYFAPRGYSVVMVDLRGTGRSTGCLDHIGQQDAEDMKAIIEWAALQEWSNGRVGLTGHSYVGSTPNAAAAMDPDPAGPRPGLVTIAPSAGLASMYDHQYNKGVPWSLQWVGPMVAYEELAMARDLPPGLSAPVSGAPTGDNFENAPNPQFGCGWQNSSLTAGTGQVTGQYQAWHAERDWRDEAAAADLPIFMIHGVNDNAARIPAAEWFFGDRGLQKGDKIWLGQWDHGSTNGRCGDENNARVGHPTCRFDQFQYALHAWFDRHLMQRKVSTGPAVEVFLNGERPVNVTTVVDPETLGGKVYSANKWSATGEPLTLFPDATAAAGKPSLLFEPPAENGSASFRTLADGVLVGVGRGRATFASAAMAEDTLFTGLPQLNLDASVTSQVIHLTATLFRERDVKNEKGEVVGVEREPMNFCAINPLVRNGIETVTPVTPGARMDLEMQCFTMAHWVPAGQRMVLEISTDTPHHATFGTDPNITVFTGPEATAYSLPEVTRFGLANDVPLREPLPPLPAGSAQAPIEGSVTVPAPGAGVQVEGLTAAAFEFDVEPTGDGITNARLEALASPAIPGDIDIYLQVQEDDEWSTVASGTHFVDETIDETAILSRPPGGHYRLLVHNWAGGPQQVDITITFFDQEGVAGEGSATAGQATEALLLTNESFGGLLQP